MSKPQAYHPVQGAKFQILVRTQWTGRTWEHCDYATSAQDKKHLLEEYRLAYRGQCAEFKAITLPVKFWKE